MSLSTVAVSSKECAKTPQHRRSPPNFLLDRATTTSYTSRLLDCKQCPEQPWGFDLQIQSFELRVCHVSRILVPHRAEPRCRACARYGSSLGIFRKDSARLSSQSVWLKHRHFSGPASDHFPAADSLHRMKDFRMPGEDHALVLVSVTSNRGTLIGSLERQSLAFTRKDTCLPRAIPSDTFYPLTDTLLVKDAEQNCIGSLFLKLTSMSPPLKMNMSHRRRKVAVGSTILSYIFCVIITFFQNRLYFPQRVICAIK